MSRVSDFTVLSLQILLGYLLVHFASPWTENIILLSLAIISFSTAALIGVKALIDLGTNFAVAPSPHQSSKFVTKGIYSKIRHPMYLSVLLAAFSVVLAGFNVTVLSIFLVVVMFFKIKIYFEERYLEEKFPEYISYTQTTGRLLPKFHIK